MGQLYGLVLTMHNAVGGLTLLLTLAAAVILLATARTRTTAPALVLRGSLISASVQFLLGVTLIITAIVIGRGGEIGNYWFHYLLGILSVGLVSVFTARARRAPDTDARRYGAILLGVLAVVLATFLVGQFRYQIV